MFGYSGGESPSTVSRKKEYRTDARRKWPFLTTFDFSTISNEAQLSTIVRARSSITPAQAARDVKAWMEGKQF